MATVVSIPGIIYPKYNVLLFSFIDENETGKIISSIYAITLSGTLKDRGSSIEKSLSLLLSDVFHRVST
jgi:hypothetical protein